MSLSTRRSAAVAGSALRVVDLLAVLACPVCGGDGVSGTNPTTRTHSKLLLMLLGLLMLLHLHLHLHRDVVRSSLT